MVEAGWYRVDEDPPGTLRRWNGEQWIGVPTLMESAAGPAEAKPLARIAPAGVAAAFITIGGFAFMALFMISLTLRIHRGADAVASDYFDERGIGHLGEFVDGFGWHLLLIAGLVVATSISFSAWVSHAALASYAVTSSRLRSTGSSDYNGSQAIELVSRVVDIVTSPIELFVSSYFFRGSSRAPTQRTHSTQRHRPGIFNLVNRIVESCDGEPLKVLAWWVLMWVPAVVGLGAWIWVAFFGRETFGSMQAVLRITEGVLALEILSLAFIMITIVSITRRLTPSAGHEFPR